MRVPQVSDRIKEAPAQALRGVFAGIGQLLLITDKLRNKTPAGQQVPQARAPEPSETRADPAPAAAAAQPPPAAGPGGPGGSAGPRGPGGSAGPAAPPAQRVPEARDFDKTGNVRLITSEEAGPGAPLPNYERAVDRVAARAAAEPRPHAAAAAGRVREGARRRAEVMTMFERRIVKLEAEASAERHAETDAEAEAEAREEVAGEAQAGIEAEAEAEPSGP